MENSGIFLPCNNPKALLVLLHGYGASGQDMLPIAKALKTESMMCWCPDGAQPCEQYPAGRQWFSLADIDFQKPLSSSVKDRLDRAGDALCAVLKQEEFKGDVLIGGFSQGASLAIHIGLQLYPVAGILGFSGFYPFDSLRISAPLYKPPLFWYHGAQDHVVPLDRMNLEALREEGLSVTSSIDPHADHTITQKGLSDAAAFLRQVL